jgi:glutamine amidotransferase-like uncharacterized protein
LWIIIWVAGRYAYGGQNVTKWKQATRLATLLVIAVYVLNLGYAFSGTFKRLKDYEFFSRVLTGGDSLVDQESGGNRFAQSPIGRLPLPFPEDYVRGIDLQKAAFENGAQSYLLGKWADYGWWYYYLVGLAVKVPLGTITLTLLVTVSAIASCRPRSAARPSINQASAWVNSIVVLTPAIALLLFVSVQDGFSRHFRYVLPAFPFAFIWLSQSGRYVSREYPLRAIAVLFCLAESVCSSMATYPHSMSYFNAAVGGPRNGHRYLLDSSFSWRQDVFYLKRWLDKYLQHELPFVTVSTRIPAEDFGINHRGSSPTWRGGSSRNSDPEGPVPGWHAIDIQWIWDRKREFRYFLEFAPVATVGYSIYVYHITPDEANRVRRTLGLTAFETQDEPRERFIRRLAEGSVCERTPRVAIYANRTEDGGPLVVSDDLIACLGGFAWQPIDASDIANGELDNFDLVVFPGGKAHKQATDLELSGQMKVREFVKDGGGYLGVCAGAFLGSSTFEWSLSLVNAEARTGTRNVPKIGRQMWLNRGSGDVQVQLSHAGLKILGGKRPHFTARYTGGPIFRPGRRTDLGEYVALAYYTSEVYLFEFQKNTMSGTPAIIAAPYGEGAVILVGSHAEFRFGQRDVVRAAIMAAAKSR